MVIITALPPDCLNDENRIHVDESDYHSVENEKPPFQAANVVEIRSNGKFLKHYECMQELGEGKFGKVYRCREKATGLELAAKRIKIKRDADREKVEREVAIMTRLKHPMITQIYDAFATVENEIILIMEIVNGGELFDRVVDEKYILTELAVMMIVSQLCEAISFMHSMNIVHLDIKPENIMCVSQAGNRIKLIDFGLAQFYDGSSNLLFMAGTPEFVAPEVIKFEPIDFHTDMWSIGVITYILLSGISPFLGETLGDTYVAVEKGEWEFDEEAFECISDAAKDFIAKLLIINQWKRMLPNECLQHPWIVDNQMKAKYPLIDRPTENDIDVCKPLSKEGLSFYVRNQRFRKVAWALVFLIRSKRERLKNVAELATVAITGNSENASAVVETIVIDQLNEEKNLGEMIVDGGHTGEQTQNAGLIETQAVQVKCSDKISWDNTLSGEIPKKKSKTSTSGDVLVKKKSKKKSTAKCPDGGKSADRLVPPVADVVMVDKPDGQTTSKRGIRRQGGIECDAEQQDSGSKIEMRPAGSGKLSEINKKGSSVAAILSIFSEKAAASECGQRKRSQAERKTSRQVRTFRDVDNTVAAVIAPTEQPVVENGSERKRAMNLIALHQLGSVNNDIIDKKEIDAMLLSTSVEQLSIDHLGQQDTSETQLDPLTAAPITISDDQQRQNFTEQNQQKVARLKSIGNIVEHQKFTIETKTAIPSNEDGFAQASLLADGPLRQNENSSDSVCAKVEGVDGSKGIGTVRRSSMNKHAKVAESTNGGAANNKSDEKCVQMEGNGMLKNDCEGSTRSNKTLNRNKVISAKQEVDEGLQNASNTDKTADPSLLKRKRKTKKSTDELKLCGRQKNGYQQAEGQLEYEKPPGACDSGWSKAQSNSSDGESLANQQMRPKPKTKCKTRPPVGETKKFKKFNLLNGDVPKSTVTATNGLMRAQSATNLLKQPNRDPRTANASANGSKDDTDAPKETHSSMHRTAVVTSLKHHENFSFGWLKLQLEARLNRSGSTRLKRQPNELDISPFHAQNAQKALNLWKKMEQKNCS